MKAEITLTHKTMFFYLYYGRNYTYNNEYGIFNNKVGNINQYQHMPTAKLALNPLSSISDEDLDFIFNAQSKLLMPEKVGGLYEDHIMFCDYLRSKGYALPWMGLSVEEMVEAGWIKLKD